MARLEPEELRDPELILLAWSVRVARRVEECLTMLAVEYAVQVEPMGRTFLFNAVRNGAAFYVASEQAAYCRERLIEAGLGGDVVEGQG